MISPTRVNLSVEAYFCLEIWFIDDEHSCFPIIFQMLIENIPIGLGRVKLSKMADVMFMKKYFYQKYLSRGYLWSNAI